MGISIGVEGSGMLPYQLLRATIRQLTVLDSGPCPYGDNQMRAEVSAAVAAITYDTESEPQGISVYSLIISWQLEAPNVTYQSLSLTAGRAGTNKRDGCGDAQNRVDSQGE